MAAAWRRRRRLGESDCEEIRTGLVAQPVNALSSLAYVAGGGWVAMRGVQAGQPAAVAFGGLLGAVGLGQRPVPRSVPARGATGPRRQPRRHPGARRPPQHRRHHGSPPTGPGRRAGRRRGRSRPAGPSERPLHQPGRRCVRRRRGVHRSPLRPEPPPARTGGGRRRHPRARRVHQRAQPHGRPALSSQEPSSRACRVARAQRRLARRLGPGRSAPSGG